MSRRSAAWLLALLLFAGASFSMVDVPERVVLINGVWIEKFHDGPVTCYVGTYNWVQGGAPNKSLSISCLEVSAGKGKIK